MKIYLVRHGQSIHNQKNVYQPENSPLSELGLSQANFVSKRFKSIDIDIIYASPYKRATQTAQIIKSVIKKEIIFSDLLIEYKRPSSFTGINYHDVVLEKIKQKIKQNADNPNWYHSDEENFTDFKNRAKQFLNLLSKTTHKNILIVSHEAFIKVFISYLMYEENLTHTDFERLYKFLKMTNTGITILQKIKDWKLITWNDHAHLGETP